MKNPTVFFLRKPHGKHRLSQSSHEGQKDRVFFSKLPFQILSQLLGECRTFSRGRYGEQEVPPFHNGRDNEIAVQGLIHGINQQAPHFSKFTYPMVQFLIIGGGNHQKNPFQVPLLKLGAQIADFPLFHQSSDLIR